MSKRLAIAPDGHHIADHPQRPLPIALFMQLLPQAQGCHPNP